MELDYIREFVVLSKTCQFLETANQLYISQSSLSKHIKTLEKDLGKELLNRSTRRVELSEFGKAFLPYAQQLVEIQDEFTISLLGKDNRQKKRVFIGITPFVTMIRLNNFIEDFFKKHPDYNIDVIEHEGNQLRELLSSGDLDMIIASPDSGFSDENFHVRPYETSNLVAVMPTSASLSKREILKSEDLRKYTLIKLGKEELPQLFDPTLPPASLTTGRANEMMDLILRGMGIGILPYTVAHHFLKTGLSIVNLEPQTPVDLNILYLRHRKKNLFVIQAFLEYLQNTEAN